MSEPFFDYIRNNREVISSSLYGSFAEPKDYARYEYIPLPKGMVSTTKSFAEVVLGRRTNRQYTDTSLTPVELGTWLYWSMASRSGETATDTGFLFPSGGSLFPLELYLVLHNVDGFEPGIYHYNPRKHAVARISSRTLTSDEFHHVFRSYGENASRAPVVVCMTMVKERAIQKYGALSYLISLVEAGHRGHALYLSASACGLACSAYITPEYDALNTLLGVDGVNEHYMYAVAAGHAH